MYRPDRNYSYRRRLLSLALMLGCPIGSLAFPRGNVHGQASKSAVNNTRPASEQFATEKIKDLSQRALSFEANQGQSDARVKFLSRGSNYSFFLTPTEAVLSLRQKPDQNPAVVRMKIVGANPNPEVMGQQELPGKVNYFNGRDRAGWQSNISTYARVYYQNVYPGVDLVYYGKQRELEYDFIVAPNRDPRKIQLAFAGARELRIDQTGALVLETAGGAIRQQAPVAYQEIDGQRQQVKAGYVLKNQRQVSFEVGDYDPARPLVIDPVIDYSSYLGGSAAEEGNDIAVDGNGYIYVTGVTFSANFPVDHAVKNTCTNCSTGGSEAFITKIDPSLGGVDSLVSSTFWGQATGAGVSEGRAIAFNSWNQVLVVGLTSAQNFPTTPGALQPTYQPFSGTNSFLSTFDQSTNSLVYSTYLMGNNVDEASDLAVDDNNTVYIAGRTASTNFPVTPGNAFQVNNAGIFDAFVMQFRVYRAGIVYGLQYSTYLGGYSDDGASNIALDIYGNAYLTGSTQSADLTGTPQWDGFPVRNAYQATKGAGQDAFVTKMDLTESGEASLLYSTYLGGNGNENATVQVGGIAVDKSAEPQVYVTGTTNSTDFPRRNPWDDVLGGYDAFVTKIDASLEGDPSLIYSTFLGGGGIEFGNDIAVDNSGQAYVTGTTQSNDFPSPCGFADAPSWDGFMTVLDSSGSGLAFSTYLGGNGYDQSFSIAVDASGAAHITGSTDSSDFPFMAFPFTVGFQPTLGGGARDAFVTKVTPWKCS